QSGHAPSGPLSTLLFSAEHSRPPRGASSLRTPPSAPGSRAQRRFPALTSAGDDLSAGEAGEAAAAAGRAGASCRALAGRGGAAEGPPPSAGRGQWAPPSAPPPPRT
ncbi:Hypothetical predicted protein, partial [Marmota monax]